MEERPEHAAMHTTTHVALEAQSEKTDELLAKISGLEKRLQSKGNGTPSADLIAINQRLAVMEKDLKELPERIFRNALAYYIIKRTV